MIFPVLIATSLYPRLSAVFGESYDSFKKIIYRTLKYVLILDIFLMVAGFLLADKFITLLYGEQYLASILVLKILIVGSLFKFFAPIFINILYSANKQLIYTRIIFFGLLLNAILCFILIPKYAVVGAAISIAISNVFIISVSFFTIKRLLSKNTLIKENS
jgi:O-antigen/teichoic acid export membrane protein